MDQNPKQQVSEQLKNAKAILVTTTNNPSVDEVASVIGLTHMLQAMKKHASAVISSSTPAALKFLKPEELIEASTDRLRDFIVSFDKEKADKLRYKVEDDQVKIFITPYKTIISKEDFEFTQGDFNVDTIVVLGATKRDELDGAVLKHSRILHEADIITINAGKDKTPALGSINWHEPEASSVSELLVSISEALGSGLLSKDSSQALLTGIVAATDMFSNPATSPKVMTMAAQLMAAGADQQQIMKELKAGQEISADAHEIKDSAPTEEVPTKEPVKEEPKKDDDVMLDLGSARKEKGETKTPEPPKPTEDASQSPLLTSSDTKVAEQPSIQLESEFDTPTPEPAKPASKPKTSESNKPTVKNESASAPPKQSQKHAIISDAPTSLQGQVFEHQQPQAHSKQTSPQLPKVAKDQPTAQKKSEQTLPPPPVEQPPQHQQPAGESTNQPVDDANDGGVDAARKAVQDAIAQQPSPLPTPRQSTSSQELPEQGSGDIHIDHEGNIQSK